MTTFTLHHFKFDSLRTYANNVGLAARALLAALLATPLPQTDPTNPQQAASQLSAGERAKGLRELFRMAAHYESVAPNLSAELRFLALRN